MIVMMDYQSRKKGKNLSKQLDRVAARPKPLPWDVGPELFRYVFLVIDCYSPGCPGLSASIKMETNGDK
jgi:hypothetical protein